MRELLEVEQQVILVNGKNTSPHLNLKDMPTKNEGL